ncbi:MAG: pyridoxal phosphate-dependent aminotransferase [Thermodesulfobacteriota bacterium]
MIRPSDRVMEIEESPTLAVTARAKEMRARGLDVIGLAAGEPDFDTPENIKKAAQRAIEEGHTKYTAVGGIAELKAAIIGKFKGDNSLTYAPDEILVSSGGKHSFYNLCQAFLNPGDEVIVSAPYWVSYPPMVRLAGGVPVIVPTDESTGFKMTAGAMAERITEKTRAVIINSPSNPTGALYTPGELRAVADAAVKKGLLVISDEIYEKLVYDDGNFVSVASLSGEIKERTIVLNGVSKAYSMTGWRIGYGAGPAELIKAMTKVQSQSTSNPASVSQWAAVEALNGPQGSVGAMRDEFEKRRSVMVKRLNAMEGVSCVMPEGAFYAFPEFGGAIGKKTIDGKAIDGSVALASYLLDEAEVAVVPGIGFGNDSHLRLSYACSVDNIEEGLKRIAEALGRLK